MGGRALQIRPATTPVYARCSTPWRGHAELSGASAITRRDLLTGIGSIVVGAPAIVRASSLMPVKVVGSPSFPSQPNERHYAGWIDRLAYHLMDNVLKAGWTVERAAPFYGGMSENQMRSAVDTAASECNSPNCVLVATADNSRC